MEGRKKGRERRERGSSYPFRRGQEEESRLERRQETCFPWQKEGVGSGRSLYLQGTGYPGDRAGQQITTRYPRLT